MPATDQCALVRFNQMPPAVAAELMLRCCASVVWGDLMVAARPYRSLAQLSAAADRYWRELPAEEWLQGFSGHPEIGDSDAAGDARDEQAGVVGAAKQTRDALIRCNREYRRKFGFIFIVCASGRSADALLGILRERLGNSRDRELANAAEEQRKITRLRIHKLFAGEAPAAVREIPLTG